MHKIILSGSFAICVFLGGCGTYVPEIAEVWDGPNGTKELEFNIKKAVFCEIRTAIASLEIVETVNGKPVAYLPDDWGAQVTLSLEVDETNALNPGVTFNTLLPTATKVFSSGPTVATPQTRNLGFGGTVSSTSSRIDKFNMYYSVHDLRKPIDTKNDICITEPPKRGSSLFLISDLGIQKWLSDALEVDRMLPSSSKSSSAPPIRPPLGGAAKPDTAAKADTTAKPDTISYEIKFVVVSSGNITPSWKLVQISANTANSSFFGVGRTRSHDLILTLGPSTGAEGDRANGLHFSSQLGAAAAQSLRPLLSSPPNF